MRGLLTGLVVVLSGCGGGGVADAGAGGGTNTGGGTVFGGGNGSTGGGNGSTGGGSGSTGGLGTFLRVGFDSQRIAAGPDGTMHLAFEEGAAERVFYGSCGANCGTDSAWNVVQLRSAAQLGTTVAGPMGLEVDASGRVHLLIAGVAPLGQTANTMVYATCASSCGNVASWSFLDLSSLAPNHSPIGTTSTFMVSSAGQVSFLNQGQFNSVQASFLSCASGCTTLSNWSAGAVLNGNPLHAVLDGAGVRHVMLAQGRSTANEDLLFYARCASNCTAAASWQVSPLGFITNTPLWTGAFAVSAAGRVFMAFNQGVLSSNPPDARKVLINSCLGAGCLDLNTWSSFSLGALDEGASGLWLEPAGDALALATTADFDVHLRTCEGTCETAAAWSVPTGIDTAGSIAQAIAPDTGSSCPGSSQSASWWPHSPRLAIGVRGLVAVHNPYSIVKCPQLSSPNRLPPIGRVVSSF